MSHRHRVSQPGSEALFSATAAPHPLNTIMHPGPMRGGIRL